MKLTRVVALGLLVAGVSTTQALAGQPQPPSNFPPIDCMLETYFGSEFTPEALSDASPDSYSRPFGKRPRDWTSADFDALSQFNRACIQYHRSPEFRGDVGYWERAYAEYDAAIAANKAAWQQHVAPVIEREKAAAAVAQARAQEDKDRRAAEAAKRTEDRHRTPPQEVAGAPPTRPSPDSQTTQVQAPKPVEDEAAKCTRIAGELEAMPIDDEAGQKIEAAKKYWYSTKKETREARQACDEMWRVAEGRIGAVGQYRTQKERKSQASICREMAAKHRKVIEGSGVKNGLLDQPIYLVEYAGAPFTRWMSVREWMGCMLDKGKVERIEGASKGFMGDAGVHLKSAGQPGIHLLFSSENNQLYPSYYGLPDALQRLDNPVKQQQIGDLMRNLIK